jgi:hypothetical protein
MSMRDRPGTHPLEAEFDLPASEILDAIGLRPRCKMSVKGAVAEQHLDKHLTDLFAKGEIDEFQALYGDHEPDFIVRFRGRDFRIECKNVQTPKWKAEHLLKRKRRPDATEAIKIDFKKTRNQKAADAAGSTKSLGNSGRFYERDRCSVLAACLKNRTGNWEFRFIGTQHLSPHKDYADRLSDKVQVDIADEKLWKRRLTDVLEDSTTLSIFTESSLADTGSSNLDAVADPLNEEA